MSLSVKKPLTILFINLDGYGHLNACIGVAEKLVKRCHRVIFAVEYSWKGKVSKYKGIEEKVYVDKTRDPDLKCNEHWIQEMELVSKTFGKSPFEALKVKQELNLDGRFMNTLLNVDEEFERIIGEVKPDVIIVDSYTTIPAVFKSGIVWINLVSAHPLVALPGDDLPPMSTGFPVDGDRSLWEKYKQALQETSFDAMQQYNKRLVEEFGLPPLVDGLGHPSPYLNIYAYPRELDYLDIRPLPEKWRSFDHFIRFGERDETFEIPKEFLDQKLGKLVYVSMGSMGCADKILMNRLIDILGDSPNRFIFSLGPYHQQFKLRSNQWGKDFLPQTQLLPMVDLVITHGGNNTTLESLYYGKPMIVVPLFGDQLTNAQRVLETGFGDRVNVYVCQPSELLEKVERVLYDKSVLEKVAKISKRMQSSDSTEKVAIAVEELVESYRK